MEIEFQVNIKNTDFGINETFLLKLPVHKSKTAPEVVEPIKKQAIQAIETSDLCKGCQAPILWRTNTATDKRSPIDPVPNPSGEILLADDGIHFTITKDLTGSPNQVRFMSHWKTCPNAAEFSKKRS